jgi:hypothetical protein
MYDLSGAKGWRKRPQISAEAKGIQSAIKTDILRPSAEAHKAPVEMEEKEPKPKASIRYILERLSEVLPQDERADVGDTSFVRAPIEVYTPPEEGVRLIRAFIRIKQPELRAAIIKLATQMADVNIDVASSELDL